MKAVAHPNSGKRLNYQQAARREDIHKALVQMENVAVKIIAVV